MGLSTVLQSFKQLKGDLYLTTFGDGTEIVFKLPSWKEALRYQKLLSLVQDEELQNLIFEYIFKECAVDDFILNNGDLPAGIISSTIGIILSLSMAVDHTSEDVNVTLEKHRELSNSYIAHMRRIICSVFPSYKFSDVNELNYQELLEVFVNAEQILIERGIIDKEMNITAQNEEQEQSMADRIKDDVKQYHRFQADQTDKMTY